MKLDSFLSLAYQYCKLPLVGRKFQQLRCLDTVLDSDSTVGGIVRGYPSSQVVRSRQQKIRLQYTVDLVDIRPNAE